MKFVGENMKKFVIEISATVKVNWTYDKIRETTFQCVTLFRQKKKPVVNYEVEKPSSAKKTTLF